MEKEDKYKKIEKHLFASKEEARRVLTPSLLEIKERMMLSVTKLLDDPMIKDQDMIKFLMGGCGGACKELNKTQAYNDMGAVRKIVGNIQGHSKSWYRYMIVEGAKEAYEIAKIAKDAKGMAAALDKIGKYTRADKEDDAYDWNQLVPPSFEPSDDVTLLEGLQPIADLEKERESFRNLFKQKFKSVAEDAETIE